MSRNQAMQCLECQNCESIVWSVKIAKPGSVEQISPEFEG